VVRVVGRDVISLRCTTSYGSSSYKILWRYMQNHRSKSFGGLDENQDQPVLTIVGMSTMKSYLVRISQSSDTFEVHDLLLPSQPRVQSAFSLYNCPRDLECTHDAFPHIFL
jgi:hypothetical protein